MEHIGQTPAAMTIRDFSRIYGVSRTFIYREIGAQRLRIRKAGRRTLIAASDAESWWASLPEGGGRRPAARTDKDSRDGK